MLKIVSQIFLLLVILGCGDKQQNKKKVFKIISNNWQEHKLRSVTYHGDSIIINRNAIEKNTNLPSFIHDLKENSYNVEYKSDNIPPFIRSFLEKYNKGKFTIADPGKSWNCCDAFHDESLPDRSLIFIGQNKHLFLINYLLEDSERFATLF